MKYFIHTMSDNKRQSHHYKHRQVNLFRGCPLIFRRVVKLLVARPAEAETERLCLFLYVVALNLWFTYLSDGTLFEFSFLSSYNRFVFPLFVVVAHDFYVKDKKIDNKYELIAGFMVIPFICVFQWVRCSVNAICACSVDFR